MITLLLACTHTPAVLYPTPIVRPVLEVGALPSPLPGDLASVLPVVAGEPPPDVLEGVALHDALLVPPVRFAELQQSRLVADRRADALEVCYAGRQGDRARGQDAYSTCSLERHQALQREAGLRLAVPLAAVLGVALGAGVGVGVAWALPR